MALSGTIASLDLMLSLSAGPSGMWSLWLCSLSWCATACLVVAIFLGVFLVLFIYGRHWIPLRDPRFFISLALFLGVMIRLVLLLELVHIRLEWSYVILCAISGGMAIVVASLFFFRTDSARSNVKILGWAMLCLAAADMSVLIWAATFQRGPFWILSSPSVLIPYGTWLLAIAWACLSRSARLRWTLACMFAMAFLIRGAVNDLWVKPGGSNTKAHAVSRVLLIVVDTLRADAISFHHPHTAPTPNMDALARDSVVFRRAISPAPWTLPAMTSLFTGVSPTVHLATQAPSQVPKGLPWLAEIFREAGYYTAAFGYNPVLQGEGSAKKGFSEFHFLRRESMVNNLSLGGRIVERFFRERVGKGRTSAVLSRGFLQWMEGKEELDFLIWMHYFDPHGPYVPPDRFIPSGEIPGAVGRRFNRVSEIRSGHWIPDLLERQWIRRLYEGEVRLVDEALGEVIEGLKNKGLYEDTLIVLTSDHGEEILEHGGCGHGQSLYDELIHVPLWIKLPKGWGKEPGVVQLPVSTEGLLPSLLDLCDIPYRKEAFTGRSFAAHLGSASSLPSEDLWDSEEDFLVSAGLLYFEDKIGILFDDLKYKRSVYGGKEWLYDLKEDPGELRCVADVRPEAMARARGFLITHDERSARLREQYDISSPLEGKMDGQRIQQLRELGYLQ